MYDIFIICKLQFKLLIKSMWNLVYFLGTLALSLFMLQVSQQFSLKTLGTWVDGSIYINIYFLLCCIGIGINVSHNKNEFLLSLNIKSLDFTLGKIIALFIYSLMILIIPIAIILYFGFMGLISIGLLLNFSIYILITWGITIVTSAAVGFFIGVIIKSKVSYILAVPICIILSPYNYVILRKIKLLPFSNILNGTKERTGLIYSDLFGFSFDKNFLLDKLFLIIFTFMLIYLSIFVESKNRNIKTYLRFLVINIIFVILIYFNGKAAYLTQSVYLNNPNAKFVDFNKQSSYNLSVTKYDISANLNENFSGSCNFKLKNLDKKSIDNITIRLDESLNIEKILVENEEVLFERNYDYIYLEGIKINPQQEINISVQYYGRIDYKDIGGNKVCFVENQSALLPQGFAWYPVLEGDHLKKEFNVKIISSNALVSNLNNNTAQSNEKVKRLSGKSENLYVVSGFMKTIKLDGRNITGGVEIINRNLNNVEKFISNTKNKDFDFKDIVICPINQQDNFVPYLVYDDYIMLNEISIRY